MSKTKTFLLLTVVGGLTAACGNTDLERAGTGAVGGAVAGEVLFDEAAAGAAVGAVGGALADDI